MLCRVADLISSDCDITYLRWSVRSWVLPLIQLVPALHQFDDHGVAEVDQLEACNVGSTMHEALQVDVLKTLEEQQEERVVMSPDDLI